MEWKPYTDFNRNKNPKMKDGYHSVCRTCHKKYYREYSDRPGKREMQQRRSAKARDMAKANYAAYVDSRGGCCELCNTNYPYDIYEFHHVKPTEKEFHVVASRWTDSRLEETRAEAEKCALLCPTCHRLEHWALREGFSLIAHRVDQRKQTK